MSWLRRREGRRGRSDEERLSDEVRDWATSVPDTRRIGTCAMRERCRVSGEVKRITLRPSEDAVSLEAVLTDGTGELLAVWMGRADIPGLVLGRRMILDGVVAQDRGRHRMVNPRFEFA
jgi:hypothetical protein